MSKCVKQFYSSKVKAFAASLLTCSGIALLSYQFGWVQAEEPVTSNQEGRTVVLEKKAIFDSMLTIRFSVSTSTSIPEKSGEVYISSKGILKGNLKVENSEDADSAAHIPANESVYLLKDGSIVSQSKIGNDGSFALQVDEPGKYEVGASFEKLSKGMPKSVFRQTNFQDAPKNPVELPKEIVIPNGGEEAPKEGEVPAEGELPPEGNVPGGDEALPMGLFAIGTPANGNSDVALDGDGIFRHQRNRRTHYASNDSVYLDAAGDFRGVVTTLDENLIRRPLPNTNVYALHKGRVVGRTITSRNGGFAFAGITPGAYTMIAEYGMAELRQTTSPDGFVGTTAAWELAITGQPWGTAPGQLAIQQIAIRANPNAGLADGETVEFRRKGNPAIVMVSFKQPDEMPVLHLSPSPWPTTPVPVEDDPDPISGGGGGFGGGGIGAAAAAAGLTGLIDNDGGPQPSSVFIP